MTYYCHIYHRRGDEQAKFNLRLTTSDISAKLMLRLQEIALGN